EFAAVRVRVRGAARAVIEHGRIQQLQANPEFPALTHKKRERGSMAAPGAFATQSDASRVCTQLISPFVQPRKGGVAILDGAGEASLRSQPVVDGDDDAAQFCREGSVHSVID